MDNNMTDKNIYDINSYYKTEYDSESEKDDEYTDEDIDEEDITEDAEDEENLEDINEYSDRVPVPSDEEFAKNIKKYNESYERKIKELQIKEEKYGNSLKRKPKKDIFGRRHLEGDTVIERLGYDAEAKKKKESKFDNLLNKYVKNKGAQMAIYIAIILICIGIIVFKYIIL